MNFNAEKYLVSQNASIKEALEKIEQNHLGFIFSCDEQGKVLGLATDGDIRRSVSYTHLTLPTTPYV